MKRPLLICLTSTRNYGWVTSAFLHANSMWADYIIIVDQMSTDGTREMALQNPKVILLDDKDMAYSETKRSEMAINRAREIKGDKIFIYLAIDEVLPANIKQTEGWKKIINSKQGEIFCFKWANLLPDKKHYFNSGHNFWMARGFHDDNITPYNNDGLDMHTHCIPYPNTPVKETLIDDFSILHFAVYNEKWNKRKQRFYQFVDFDKNNRSAVQLSRMYKQNLITGDIKTIPTKWLHTVENSGFNLFAQVNLDSEPLFDKYIFEFIEKNGIDRYKKLNVWDKEFRTKHKIKDPRSLGLKIIHFYLDKTQNFTKNIVVRFFDKFLKLLGY